MKRTDEEVAALFTELAAQWKRETAFCSDVERIVLNMAYQRIIGLGPQVIPLIMDDMSKKPTHWFWALAALLGEDKAAGETTVPGAAARWMQWWVQAGTE